jgi:hypothetical protein
MVGKYQHQDAPAKYALEKEHEQQKIKGEEEGRGARVGKLRVCKEMLEVI